MRIGTKRIVINISLVFIVIVLLMVIGWLWLSNHNLYLDAVNERTYRKRGMIDRYANAKRISDLPTNRLVIYKCLWKARHVQTGMQPVVDGIRIIGPSRTPGMRVILWLDQDNYVKYAAVCGDCATESSCQSLVDTASHLLGRRLESGQVVKRLQPTDIDDIRCLFSRKIWREKRRLVAGDLVSVPDSTYQLIFESSMVGFYWLADKRGRIVARGMMGS